MVSFVEDSVIIDVNNWGFDKNVWATRAVALIFLLQLSYIGAPQLVAFGPNPDLLNSGVDAPGEEKV